MGVMGKSVITAANSVRKSFAIRLPSTVSAIFVIDYRLDLDFDCHRAPDYRLADCHPVLDHGCSTIVVDRLVDPCDHGVWRDEPLFSFLRDALHCAVRANGDDEPHPTHHYGL